MYKNTEKLSLTYKVKLQEQMQLVSLQVDTRGEQTN